MCSLCDASEGDIETCQDCGIWICFDVRSGDDLIAPAYVTARGDVYCARHGAAHDRAAEAQDDSDGAGDWEEVLL